jgi:hypothetical protein
MLGMNFKVAASKSGLAGFFIDSLILKWSLQLVKQAPAPWVKKLV